MAKYTSVIESSVTYSDSDIDRIEAKIHHINDIHTKLSDEERNIYAAYLKKEREEFDKQQKQLDDMDDALASTKKKFDAKLTANMLLPAALILVSTCGPYLAKMAKILHTTKGKNVEQLEMEVDKLRDQLADIQKSIKDGTMSTKTASQKANSIFLKMSILGKRIRKLNKQQFHESADFNWEEENGAMTYDELLALILESKVDRRLLNKYGTDEWKKL